LVTPKRVAFWGLESATLPRLRSRVRVPFSARRTFERKGDKKQNPYVSMIRKVFCFRGIVYSESDCPSPDPAPFVPAREEDANCGRCVGFHRCAFNSLHAAYVRPFRVVQPCFERYFPFFCRKPPISRKGQAPVCARITASPSPSGRNPHPLPNRAGASEPERLGRSPDIGIPDFSRQVAKRLR